MPRVTYRTGALTAFADGAGDHRHIIDITKLLSAHYGKLIRQANLVKVKHIGMRLYNPATGSPFELQDMIMTASGRLCFYEPTGNRMKAYKSGFQAVQKLRKLVGLKNKYYDFRVGLEQDFPEVSQQAWVKSEEDELFLSAGRDPQRGIFDVHNQQNPHRARNQPIDEDLNGFGFPFDFVGLGQGDADFKEGTPEDSGFYVQGRASTTLDTIPFQLAFAGAFDNLGTDDHVGVTNSEQLDVDILPMCGLIGVIIDSTIPDDGESQGQDFGLEITLDVESWKPMLKSKKKSRRKRKSKK